jgi:hypothetical protein
LEIEVGEAKRRRSSVTHCYLCGEELSDPVSADHVPPSLLYGEELRSRYNLSKLLTIPTHAACNHAFREDEEYFVYTLMPLGRGSEGGNAVWNQVFKKYKQGRNVPLAEKVRREFRREVGGIILPRSKIAKLVDANRFHDVIWKIIRGLYFHHHKVILPKFWTCSITVTPPNETPPDHFMALTQNGLLQDRGAYRRVFAYSMHVFPEANNLHYWAFLIWDRIIVTAAFHDVQCSCADCAFIGPPLPQPLDGARQFKDDDL